jgi:hypothetical protein
MASLFLPGPGSSPTPVVDPIGGLPPLTLPKNNSDSGSNTLATGYLSTALVEWLLALIAIVIVAIAYEKDRRLGGMLLLIVALLMLRSAYERKLI